MASGLVIHIESGADKHTEVLTTDRILIGTSDKCDVRIRSGDLPTAFDSPSERIDIYRSNGYYRISNVSSSISADLNGRSVEPGVAIKDGDLVHFGECRL